MVTAGLPRRMPLGLSGGFTSNGMAFLLTVMRARSSAFSASLPRTPLENTSTSMQVRVGAAGDDAESGIHQALGQRLALATTCF